MTRQSRWRQKHVEQKRARGECGERSCYRPAWVDRHGRERYYCRECLIRRAALQQARRARQKSA